LEKCCSFDSHLTKKRHGTLGDLLEAIVGVLFICDVRVNLTTPYCAFSTCVTHIEAGAGAPLIIWRKRRLYNIIVSVYTTSQILIWIPGVGEHVARAILGEQVSFFARTCGVASTRSEKHICQIHWKRDATVNAGSSECLCVLCFVLSFLAWASHGNFPFLLFLTFLIPTQVSSGCSLKFVPPTTATQLCTHVQSQPLTSKLTQVWE